MSDLEGRVGRLEDDIRNAAKAETLLEKDSILEVAVARIENRNPEGWAVEYLNYRVNNNPNHF